MPFWKIILLGFGVALGQSVAGQNTIIIVSGTVVDSQTEAPVAFANVHLKSGGIGTATNAQGEFVLKVPATHNNDTLAISCVGYQSQTLMVDAGLQNIAVRLMPAVVQLAEVSVQAQTGLSLLKKALARIPDNYDTSAIQLRAFYREHYWLGDFELNFSEAVLDIYKVMRYEKWPNDQIRIVKGRKKNVDFGSDAQFYYWISGIANGARSSLAEDWVKYTRGRLVPFNPDNFRFFDYDYIQSIHDRDRTLLVIDIVPKPRSRRAIIRTRVYLDEQSLAIARIDFETTSDGIQWVNKHQKGGIAYTIMSKVTHATLDFTKISTSITYQATADGKWHLSSVHRHWDAVVNSRKRGMVNRPWVADYSLVTTAVQKENAKPFGTENIAANSAPISHQIGGNFDETFWENYNVLKPALSDSGASARQDSAQAAKKEKLKHVSNRQNGFTRGDTLRGKLSSLRSCYDVTFYHLDVAVDMERRSVKGSNLMRFKVTEPFHRMQIDLYANMKIHRIQYGERSLPFTREYDAVFVQFPRDLTPGKEEQLVIYYEGIPKTPDWSIPMNGGGLWDKDSLGNPWAQMVCQGSGASLWWPNKDHLSDEPDSMKIWITVPSGYTEISNGRLQRKTEMLDGQERYEWYVSYPINNYNVTFSIGKYTHFTDQYISGDTLTIDYYVMPYNLARARKMFGQVKPMLACFEKNFGKYPFKRDGFTLVESLYPMEHQSGVCIGKITAQNSSDTNPLLWHEAAHEWWGNAISCMDLADMWIHEAFATYAETLMIESLFGKEAGAESMKNQQSAMIGVDPMIGVYDVNHIYYEIGDMYSKGSLMLHTFRNVLNDDTKWVGLLHAIQDRFRYKTLSTDELVKFINTYMQKDYTYLFDQYLRYVSLPGLELELLEQTTGLRVKYRWQADVPDFRMPVRVTIGVNRFDFIYPTPSWKTIILKGMKAADFEADEDNFLMDVNVKEGEDE